MSQPLNLASLGSLPAPIARPKYAREELSPGILHVGVGNFHRAHQAIYLDDLFNAGRDLDWALLGAGVRSGDEAMRRALAPQDWLTTVIELEPGANKARVSGSMADFVPVGEDARAIVEALDNPALRIVSLTVTEGGYCIDPATGTFNPEHPEIRYDAAHLDAPKGVFGALVAALRRRRERGVTPFTVMSCDNIPHNGRVTLDAVAGLADLVDPALASYIRDNVAFPNSMVDRITPATTDRERAILSERFGIQDNWPVFCEPFRQWVLEDNFPGGRPALEEVGVTFTSEVAAFELMKLRILNGGHAAIAYPAALLGIHFVHDAMADPLVRAFLDKLEIGEIIPHVPPVPGVDLKEYYKLIANRFANPDVGDTIPRLAQDGSNRQPKFILPSTRDRLKAGEDVTGLALESALWCRYCAATDDAGVPIALNDPIAARLTPAALAAKSDPAAFLSLRDIFGDIADAPAFRASFETALRSLWRAGTRNTLQRYLNGETL
ncbi:mannitol dehydrogenase family protein [Microvirga lotononidis]|uniref:Mannitol-1-phosphate/altronate dehydrogenase n=1 Tax=Microvirga lotononidis TaxID=864069 RepID=I4YWP6_9HYPH|nr:mannitol dehydrogenase family protein [Microvirga lotononidis]EIM28388.1 mannitol-1-phosphate/altronate dehydrogenase [Microvirga lotononidis]WQO27528.1 mannitol dehydrogenase family protein [Microvirga lotononidis]